MAHTKIEITEKQKDNYNRMLHMLRRISKYQSPEGIKKDSQKYWGLDYEEALEMSYENMQSEAKAGCKNIKQL